VTADVSDSRDSKTAQGAPDRRALLLALGLCVVVAATAYVCIEFPRSQGRIAPIWLANAWVVAALIRSRVARWPLPAGCAWLGLVAANFAVGMTPSPALGLAACNIAECLVAATIIRRLCGQDFDISRVRHLLAFVGASACGALLSASGGASLFGYIDHDSVARGIAMWTASDALGLITLTPALLVMTQQQRTPFNWREAWTLAVVILFVLHYPMLFVISAVLTLPTWRMGLPGAVAGFAILAVLGAAAVLSGHGPLVITSPSDRIIGLQIFLAVSFLTSVPVAVAHDAGERLKARLRAALDEARAARAEAEAAAAVKTEFLANMSHELRTPLTSVVGFTRLAAEQPDLAPVTRGYIERVNEASRALLCAVNDILDFSKLEAGQVTFQPEPMAVSPLLRNVLELFTPQAATKSLALRLDDATPPGLTVNLDPDRLRQVLLNLVGNAVKFTARGEVTLAATYNEDLQRLVVTIADTGIGIPAESLDSLFKRFSQVDGSLTRGHGGTGLGLAICKGIVEALGGEIAAVSEIAKGSRFTFAIPAPRTESLTHDDLLSGEPTIRPGARILVADDHPANRELVKLFLAAMDAEITEAPDGQAAVGLAALQPFDVILMDLRMPKLDGFGAVAAIRSEPGLNRTTPILAFTADAERLFDSRLEDVGFNGAVAKPLDPRLLIASIATAMADAEAHHELEVGAG
jgi:signal transduction histidine kinase/CheY-like chemotaxis protein